MEYISFNFTVEETNTVLQALGKMPYDQVYTLIHKIQNQAQAQLQPPRNDSSSPLLPS